MLPDIYMLSKQPSPHKFLSLRVWEAGVIRNCPSFSLSQKFPSLCGQLGSDSSTPSQIPEQNNTSISTLRGWQERSKFPDDAETDLAICNCTFHFHCSCEQYRRSGGLELSRLANQHFLAWNKDCFHQVCSNAATSAAASKRKKLFTWITEPCHLPTIPFSAKETEFKNGQSLCGWSFIRAGGGGGNHGGGASWCFGHPVGIGQQMLCPKRDITQQSINHTVQQLYHGHQGECCFLRKRNRSS